MEHKFRISLRTRFLALGLVAAVCAVLSFVFVDNIFQDRAESYVDSSNYEVREEEKMIARLQSYIDSNALSSDDADVIYEWLNQENYIYAEIYKNGELKVDEWDAYAVQDESFLATANEYTITFSDGEATVYILGFYDYRIYMLANAGSFAVAFLVFAVVLLLGIQRTIRYIQKLSSEIKILEGGGLEYEITVRGTDELGDLARGLEDMRLSLKNQFEKEKYLLISNREMITSMSHDIRTPLTAILLYTEIVKKRPDLSTEELRTYIERIDKKGMSMKQMLENLFEYSLVGGAQEIEMNESEPFELIFYDMISEMMVYFTEKGFQVKTELNWGEGSVCVNDGYVSRIIDNILSNAAKYADKERTLLIRTYEDAGYAYFHTKNYVNCAAAEAESNHIGLMNIRSMMEAMNGSCQIVEHDDVFELILGFPIINVR